MLFIPSQHSVSSVSQKEVTSNSCQRK